MFGCFQLTVLVFRGAFEQNLAALKVIALHRADDYNLLGTPKILWFWAVVNDLLRSVVVVHECKLEVIRVNSWVIQHVRDPTLSVFLNFTNYVNHLVVAILSEFSCLFECHVRTGIARRRDNDADSQRDNDNSKNVREFHVG